MNLDGQLSQVLSEKDVPGYCISEVHDCNYSIFRIRHTNVFYSYSVVTLVS